MPERDWFDTLPAEAQDTIIALDDEITRLTVELDTLRDRLIRRYVTTSGTPWQSCNVCHQTSSRIQAIDHLAECVLSVRRPT